MKQIYLNYLINEHLSSTKRGKPAQYIPELARVSPELLGISMVDENNEVSWAGDADRYFSIQSISKVVSLLYVLSSFGKEFVFDRVGTEPTGDPFNSVVRLETFQGKKPLNPMINAGAIVVTSMLPGKNNEEKIHNLLQFLKDITDSEEVTINYEVYESEKDTATRNRALAWLLKELGVLEGDVEEVLDLYFLQCAIEMTCISLSKLGAFLAFDGIVLGRHRRLIPIESAKIVKSLMMLCGMYDASGEFSVSIGIPAKSGVGGGILATVPGRYGIGVFSPSLDERGNSIAGTEVLKSLSKDMELSIL